ncbi:hypothetical protein NZK35_25435 [Stieleria sp. ICT_E10.1]|uniref:hypothetical protein n=1 Tax=Stieleria sedimenti TaxID=2976331 RepID=UPI0021803A11|nr:hypothetical protein [Stieleria sedimenti]MCS7470005.1 hypothetical protein [Stieleria sedimenti]
MDTKNLVAILPLRQPGESRSIEQHSGRLGVATARQELLDGFTALEYAPGATPMNRLKCRVKCDWSAKPAALRDSTRKQSLQ